MVPAKDLQTRLEKNYCDFANDAAYSGVGALRCSLKNQGYQNLSTSDIEDGLAEKDSFTLHRPARHKFQRMRTMVPKAHFQIQLDLADMSNISRYNKKFRFILFVIDCFSRKAGAIAIIDKKAETMVDALKKIFEKFPCKYVQSDLGLEFTANKIQALYTSLNIHHFSSYGGTKASLVENLIKQIKTRLYRYFTEHNTYCYLSQLEAIMKHYNNRIHSTIEMSPMDGDKDMNRLIIWKKLYKPLVYRAKEKFKLYNNVRIKIIKNAFDKGYIQNYSDEVFEIVEIVRSPYSACAYKLEDMAGEMLRGIWYAPELVKCRKSDDSKQ